ncbi:hypothetical protein [Streptomyces californicus]|uniref:hypothetical protein n=1 Tax=Streptomyces californicus TaxID=67351 RepID=UPI0036C6A409
MGTRDRRIARIRSAMPFVEELVEYTREAHSDASFHIDREAFEGMWYALPFSRTRDADALEESNWYVIAGELEEAFPESIQTHSFGHWGVGWYERLYVRADDALAIFACQKWAYFLADYAVANDEHYSETEWNHNHPSETECYSEDSECGCDKNTHDCADMLAAAIDAGAVKADDEAWWCDFCSEWNDLDDEWRVRAEMAALRADLADMEAKGQLRLFA